MGMATLLQQMAMATLLKARMIPRTSTSTLGYQRKSAREMPEEGLLDTTGPYS